MRSFGWKRCRTPRPSVHTRPARSRAAASAGDGGFSIVEVGVAIGIFALVAVFMAGSMAGGLRGIMLSKQRSAATADANQLLETARALAYDDVGLVSSDPTLDTDPEITTETPTRRFFNGEPVVFALQTANHPFNPHIQQVQRPPTDLTRHIYVTGVDTTGDGAVDVKRVTVIVSWARSAVQGVADRVTASTLVAPRSPGTPGNPPITGFGPFPPLHGKTVVKAPSAEIEVDVGAGALLGSPSRVPVLARYSGTNGHGENRLDANTRVSCTQQRDRIETGLGSLTAGVGGASVTTSSDSVTNLGPHSATNSLGQATGSLAVGPLSVSSGALAGSISCESSGVTSADSLPFEEGAGSAGQVAVGVSTGAAVLAQPLGSIRMLEITGSKADQRVEQATPADKRVNSSATHGVTEARLLRQGDLGLLGILNLGAPDGLVRVDAYEATAQAAAWAASGSTTVTANPTKPLRIRVWDDGNVGNLTGQSGNPLTSCPSRSGKYCIFSPGVNGQLFVQMDRQSCNLLGLLGVCLVRSHVQITVSVAPATQQTFSPDGGVTRVYRSDHSPVSVMARLRVEDSAGLAQLDLRTTFDLGSLHACAKHGVFPGGC